MHEIPALWWPFSRSTRQRWKYYGWLLCILTIHRWCKKASIQGIQIDKQLSSFQIINPFPSMENSGTIISWKQFLLMAFQNHNIHAGTKSPWILINNYCFGDLNWEIGYVLFVDWRKNLNSCTCRYLRVSCKLSIYTTKRWREIAEFMFDQNWRT